MIDEFLTVTQKSRLEACRVYCQLVEHVDGSFEKILICTGLLLAFRGDQITSPFDNVWFERSVVEDNLPEQLWCEVRQARLARRQEVRSIEEEVYRSDDHHLCLPPRPLRHDGRQHINMGGPGSLNEHISHVQLHMLPTSVVQSGVQR